MLYETVQTEQCDSSSFPVSAEERDSVALVLSFVHAVFCCS